MFYHMHIKILKYTNGQWNMDLIYKWSITLTFQYGCQFFTWHKYCLAYIRIHCLIETWCFIHTIVKWWPNLLLIIISKNWWITYFRLIDMGLFFTATFGRLSDLCWNKGACCTIATLREGEAKGKTITSGEFQLTVTKKKVESLVMSFRSPLFG